MNFTEVMRELERHFQPRSIKVQGLGLHRYMGGPWEKVRLYPFRGA